MNLRRLSAAFLTLFAMVSCTIFQDDPFELGSQSSGAPVVSGISPTSGPPGTPLTIVGSGFSSEVTVLVGGVACESVSVVDSSTITCVSSAQISSGSATVVVTSSAGVASPSFEGGFTSTAPGTPTVTSVSPSGGALAGGSTVTITGTGFATGATVTIGGVSATSVTVVSSTSITCVTPAASAGTADIAVTNTGTSAGTLSNGFTYRAAPTVTSVSPSGGALAGGTSVTITGTGFVSGATVTFGGSACTSPTVTSSTTMTCTTPAIGAGAVNVIVTNSDNQTGTGSGVYTYRAAPTVTSVTANSGTTAGGTSVTVAGTGFIAGATLTFGGTAATGVSVDSATQITCTTPAHAAGAVDVIVTNSDTQTGTGSGVFTFTAAAAPTVTSASPSTGFPFGGTLLTITGTGFSGSTVTVGGTAATSVVVASATSITCVTPAGTAGAADVVVTNSDTQSGTGSGAFTYRNPRLSLGGNHACFILSNSTVKCWGFNNMGQLGLGDTNDRGDFMGEMGSNLGAVSLGTGRTAKYISAGLVFTCAILDNDTLKCWGSGGSGNLGLENSQTYGDGTNAMGDALPTVSLGTGRTPKAIAASRGWMNTCAILDNNTLKCFGSNMSGEMGIGTSGMMTNIGDGAGEMGDNLAAVSLGTGRTVKQVAGGVDSFCALLDNNTVKCWGENSQGQLGKGNTGDLGDEANEMGDNLTAIDLGTGRTATQITVGNEFACALLDNGTVKCWGDNASGQLGKGSTNDLGDGANEMGDNLTAIDLGTGRTATLIQAYNNGVCAILDNSSLKCWGGNSVGQLGQGNTNNLGDGANEMGDNLTALNLGTGRTAKELTGCGSAGAVCAVLDNSDIKCWGGNAEGTLGQGNTNNLGDGANEMGDNLTAISLSWYDSPYEFGFRAPSMLDLSGVRRAFFSLANGKPHRRSVSISTGRRVLSQMQSLNRFNTHRFYAHNP